MRDLVTTRQTLSFGQPGTRTSVAISGPFRLKHVNVVPERDLLVDDQQELRLRPKVMALLACLAKRQGSVVTRDQLIDELWEGNHYVGVRAVTDTVWELRRKLAEFGLGDCIETVAKKGYSLKSGAAFEPDSPQTQRWIWALAAVVTVVIGVVAVVFLIRARTTTAPIDWRVVTSFPSAESCPRLDPSGSRLGFLRLVDDQFDIYVMQMDDSSLRRVTHTAGSELELCWSPNGTSLAAVVRNEGNCELQITDLATQVTRALPGIHVHEASALTWDRDAILYTAWLGDKPRLCEYDLNTGEQELVDGLTEEHLVIDGGVSPHDGRMFVIVNHENETATRLAALEAGGLVFMPTGELNPVRMGWTHDRNELLLAARDHPGVLWQLDLRSHRLTEITRDARLDFRRFQALPERGVLAEKQRSVVQIMGFDRQAGGFHTVTSSTGMDSAPHSSAAGDRVCFVSDRSGDPQIWMMAPDGTDPVQVTRLDFHPFKPALSPDGTRLAFIGRNGDRYRAHILALDELRVSPLGQELDLQFTGMPSWSPDGQSIYVGW